MDVIWKVARNEFKLILRSFVFRLLAMFLLMFQLAAVLFFYVTPFIDTWGLRAVPAAIPYTSTLMYQLFAAVGAVFIATDCLERDLSLDTTDSIYSRNYSAPWYMMGKSLGIMMAMLGLMFAHMLIPFVTTIFFIPDTPLVWTPYLIYPVLITIPSLLFVIGLSWLVMLITRSQAVTFVAIGIVFGMTFWANHVIGLHHLLDYPGLRIPALYSDFIGFGDAGRLFMQRALYAILGIGLMASASRFLPRLPQNLVVRRRFAQLSIVLYIMSAILVAGYLGAYVGDRSLRDELRALNHEYGAHPRATMTACDLNLVHHGNTITVEAAIGIRNDSGEPLDSYLFSLNPDLHIGSITGTDGVHPFVRNQHLLTVTPPASLAPGDTDSLVITYAGTINDRICYLDTPESERTKSFYAAFIPIQRMSGIIDPDCVLLTPETLWYPVAGVPYGSTFPNLGRKDFPRFMLTVASEPGMVPVSQGVPDILPDGRTAFRPETPLSQLSLNIARYQRQATVIDSVTYAVYVIQGHDFYSSLTEIYKEGLPEYVKNSTNSLELLYESSYPFRYFTMVETPIQFSPRSRTWTIAQDNMQPGVLLVNERGTFMWNQQTMVRNWEQYNKINDGTEDLMTKMVLINNLSKFISGSYEYFNKNAIPQIQVFSSSFPYIYFQITDDVVYNIFPNYYSFTNNYHSEQWPIINTMLERYLALQHNTSHPSNPFTLTPIDTANILLNQYSLVDILASTDRPDILNVIITAKLKQLFGTFSARIGGETFDDRFRTELAGSKFSSKSFTTLLDAIQDGAAKDNESFLDDWYTTTELPICEVGDVKHVEVYKDERTLYQLMVTLSNSSSANGLFQVISRTMFIDEQAGVRRIEQYVRHVEIPAGETRCVCFVGDDPFYEQVNINSLISQNLPAMFTVPIPEPSLDLTVALHDTVLSIEPFVQEEDPGVIIVDDNSPGCVAISKEHLTLFQRLFNRETESSEYNPVRIHMPDDTWERCIEEGLYGNHIRSGLVKATGSGDQPVTWTAQLAESGSYNVYTHIPMSLGNRNRNSLQKLGIVGTLQYTVHHGEGADDIAIQLADSSDTWIYLGSYNFSAGEASVVLSDESDGEIVFADAIKWVKK